MSTIIKSQEQSFYSVLEGRHSVRSYDSTVRITREEINEILSEATLAPSSSNIQPWRFLVIDSDELKQKLQPIAFNQSQVTQASATIVVLGDTQGYLKVDEIMGEAVKSGFMTSEVAASMIERTKGLYGGLPKEALHKIIHSDGGLVSMQLMLAAKAHGYDTCPMGGYDAAKLKEAFGISERYIPIMLITLGKADKEAHKTTRLPIDSITYFNEMPAN